MYISVRVFYSYHDIGIMRLMLVLFLLFRFRCMYSTEANPPSSTPAVETPP